MKGTKRTIELLYRLTVALLPPSIRREHGQEMMETHARRMRPAGVWTGVWELADLGRTVLREWVSAVTETTGGGEMGGWTKDFALALRSVRKRPGFALVAILTLAIGLGATTALYSVVDTVLFRSLPLPDSDELVFVWGGPDDPANRTRRSWTSFPDYTDYGARQRSLTYLAAYRQPQVILTGAGQPTRRSAARVSASFFGTVGVEPQLGRGITSEEDRVGAPPVVVLSHALWRERFGGDPAALGRTLGVDGVPHEIVGVMPPDFVFPGSDLWLPLTPDVASDSRGMHRLVLVGRLTDGVDAEAASAEFFAIAEDLARTYPDSNEGQGAWVEPVLEAYVGNVRFTLLVLLAATGLVLLVACANVANLFLVRASARRQEMAVRCAMGAGRIHVMRQLLTEGVVIALAGGLAGVGLAWFALEALVATLPPGVLPRATEVSLDGGVLTVAALAALGSVLLFALLPALRASREASAPLLSERDGGSASGGRLRGLLIVGETALTMALVVAAALLVRSFEHVTSVDPGFEPEGLFELDITLPQGRYPSEDWRRTAAFYRELERRVNEAPGVAAAALTYAHPLAPSWTTSFWFTGQEDPGPSRRPEASYRPVTPGYFETAGIEIVRGRGIRASDDATSPGIVVVNESFAEHFFPDGDALGQRLVKETWWDGTPEGEWEIVGVVEDVRFGGLERSTPWATYYPHAQRPMAEMTLVTRVARDPSDVIPAVREAIWSLDPELPAENIRAMDDVLAASTARRRFMTGTLATFALVALVLAAIGLYGVLAYAVDRRRHEMGVRLSLGASAADVVRVVTVQAARLVLAGVAIGLLLTLASGRLIESLLIGVQPGQPGTLALVTLVLFAAAALASVVPALRAARVDPVTALRSD